VPVKCICFVGVFTLMLTNPIWVAKTRLCLQYDVGPSRSVQLYTGMFDCLCKTYKSEGLRGLYKASPSDELYTTCTSTDVISLSWLGSDCVLI